MKILIIEDSAKHRDDAKNFFADKSEVLAIYSADLAGAQRFLEKGKVDGVISDIFFPYRNDSPWSQPDEPIGIGVMMLCQKIGMPCILNTDGNHHGKRLQWIHDMTGRLGLPSMVDTNGREGESKNWAEAYDRLKAIIAKSSSKPDHP